MAGPSAEAVRRRLLRWFDATHRDLPWRRTRDPYRILLAEYLLQRTRVATGERYYERFLARFPDVASLAAAPEEDVLRAWEGLGYYRRATALHRAAKEIVAHHGGSIPTTAEALEALPGIGPYTAGAVASIAFGERVPAVDGNATRVIARLFRVEDDVARRPGQEWIRRLATSLVSPSRPGPFNQALMELGATLCAPTSPKCERCPLADLCVARRAGVQESLPRGSSPPSPRTVPVAFADIRRDGRVLLVRRPSGGLLGGLWSLPGGEVGLRGGRQALEDLVREQTGLHVDVDHEEARVAHVFSHRRWAGGIYRCVPAARPTIKAGARWANSEEVRGLPLVPFHRRFLEDREARRPLEAFAPDRPARSS